MALKATINKAELNIANMDSHYYASHALTIAQHPSETEERMMVRVLAFALNASERLTFGKGLSSEDEPDLWDKSLTDEIELWIDLGQPDEKRIRKACGRARQVQIYTYQERSAAVWSNQNRANFARFENLTIKHLHGETVSALGQLAARNMNLQCNIQDGDIWLSDDKSSVQVRWLDL